MYLIVGLGNPEPEYANTRHNMGFDVLNELSKKSKITMKQHKYDGIYGNGNIENEKVILLKPQSYMNCSGDSLIQFKNYYKIPTENVIVIYDDIDIEAGKIKIKKQGGPGTHNGLKSVVHSLKSENFIRVRVGIGEPNNKEELVSYVISKIPEENRKILDEGIEMAKEAVWEILLNGTDKAMNKFN